MEYEAHVIRAEKGAQCIHLLLIVHYSHSDHSGELNGVQRITKTPTKAHLVPEYVNIVVEELCKFIYCHTKFSMSLFKYIFVFFSFQYILVL